MDYRTSTPTSAGREQRHQAVGLLPTSFRDLKNLGSVLTDDIASLFGPDDKELRAQMDAIKVQLSRYDVGHQRRLHQSRTVREGQRQHARGGWRRQEGQEERQEG